MDWRKLVLIVSLLLNGFLLSSLRKLDLQTRELTQSASRLRKDLALVSSKLDQLGNNGPRPLTDSIREVDLDLLIRNMAATEVDAQQSDCGQQFAFNANRLRSLKTRIQSFIGKYNELAQKATTANNFKDAKSVQNIANKIKADVLRECRQ